MQQVKIVIGANYGDEGKGMMTDYFAAKAAAKGERCLVVCHNGGAQRGHTVELFNGTRHVFHHFGSGAFAGADTYFAGSFLVNPIAFWREWEELERFPNCNRRCYAALDCPVTLPYDMLLNQWSENVRGAKRHGSCGMGIYETVRRNQEKAYQIDLKHWSEMTTSRRRDFLLQVREDYVKKRLSELSLPPLPEEALKLLKSPGLLEHFLEDFERFLAEVELRESSLFSEYDHVIFEGGQGLLLDQGNTDDMPYLTPSNTGLKNPAELLAKGMAAAQTEVCYVTRTYLTRHGAGPLPEECSRREVHAKPDLTNVANPYQENLRYARLQKEELISRMTKDFQSQLPTLKTAAGKIIQSLAITHWEEGTEQSEILKQWVQEQKSVDQGYQTAGKNRAAVQKIK